MPFLLWVFYCVFSAMVGLSRNTCVVAIFAVVNTVLLVLAFYLVAPGWPEVVKAYAGTMPIYQLFIQYWQFMILPALPLILLVCGFVATDNDSRLTWRDFA